MAYCKKCGAYIPDGLSACLACGYDENSEADKQGGVVLDKQQNEDFRLKYEEERRRRQEDNRRWAEQEKARREAEEQRRQEQFRLQEEQRRRAEQEQYRREAEAASERLRAEKEASARSMVYRSLGAERKRSRVFAALSYLSVLFILPRFFCENDTFARYHARQGLTLFICGVIFDAIGILGPVAWLFQLFRLYCIYKGITNALNDREEPLPLIGQFGDKL